MAVDLVHSVFPASDVAWERTPRVAKMMLTVFAGKELLAWVGIWGPGGGGWGSGGRKGGKREPIPPIAHPRVKAFTRTVVSPHTTRKNEALLIQL